MNFSHFKRSGSSFRSAIWLAAAIVLIAVSAHALPGDGTAMEENLFHFKTHDPFPEKPFDVLSNGETIDMFSGGLAIYVKDISIPGKVNGDFAAGHAMTTEPQLLNEFPTTSGSTAIAFTEDYAAQDLGTSISSVQHYTSPFDPADINSKGSIVIDSLVPMGKITYKSTSENNDIIWQPDVHDGMRLWWGDYAGVILITQIFPYSAKNKDDKLTGDRIAYLVRNDGTLESFDAQGLGLTAAQRSRGMMHYFHGAQPVSEKPVAVCRDLPTASEIDETCYARRIVEWSNDAIDGIEYIDASGNVNVFRAASGFLIKGRIRMQDLCSVNGSGCSNGFIPGDSGTGWVCGYGSLTTCEVQDVYATDLPFYRVEGFRLVSQQDAFANRRDYVYQDEKSIVVSESSAVQGSVRRHMSITKEDNGWKICGPLFDGKEWPSKCDLYETDSNGRIFKYTDRNDLATMFYYDPTSATMPPDTPHRLNSGPGTNTGGTREAFLEIVHHGGAVFRYEQYGLLPLKAKGVQSDGTRSVLVTSWPNVAKTQTYLQRRVVVNPSWEDATGALRLVASYELDGREVRYRYENLGDTNVLASRDIYIDGAKKVGEQFTYAAHSVPTPEADRFVIQGLATETLTYENQSFVTAYEYSSNRYSALPVKITRPDNGVTEYDLAANAEYSFASPITGNNETASFTVPLNVTERRDPYTNANGESRVRKIDYAWGGKDECDEQRLHPLPVLTGMSVSEDGAVSATSFCYDTNGNIQKAQKKYSDATSSDNMNVSVAYDDHGRYPISKTLGDATWTYEYDDSGRIINEVNPNGATKNYVYDDGGRVHRIVYGTNGSFREYLYGMKNEGGILYPSITTTSYDQVRVDKTKDERIFDGLGRLLLHRRDGIETSYAYNERGFLESIKTGGSTKHYWYDALGRLIHLSFPDTGLVSYAYDAVSAGWIAGQPSIAIRRSAYQGGVNVRNRYFSVDGKLLRDEQADGNGINYGYDVFGNRMLRKNPSGLESKWVYDGFSRVVSASLSTGLEMHVEKWNSTDDPGAIIYDTTGQKNTYSYYDTWNEIQAATFSGGGADYAVTFDYGSVADGRNGIGRLTTVDDPPGKTDFYYDPSGSVAYVERTIDELGSKYEISTVKDSRGRLYRITYSDGRAVYYLTDDYGRIAEIRLKSIDGPIIANFTYDDLNRLNSLQYGNGAAAIYRYVGDLLAEILIEKGNKELYHVEYAYDARGRRTEAIYHDSSRATFSYDDSDRLTKAQYYGPNEENPHDIQTYEYDSDGNRTKYTDSYKTVTYSYDTKGLLISANYKDGGGWGYSYDGFGRLAERKHLRSGAILEHQKFSWDNAGNLIRVETLDDGGAVKTVHEYAYDGSGRREKRVRGGFADYAIYGEGLDPLMELNSEGEVKRDYIYYKGRRIAAVDAERIDFFHLDDIGSTLLITDEDARVTGGYRYDPFGNVNFSIGDSENPYRFAGKHYDDETGFIYFGGRYYDPIIGRFISPDPANEWTNPYSYAADNPFGSRDVFGRSMRRAGMWKGVTVATGGADGTEGGGGDGSTSIPGFGFLPFPMEGPSGAISPLMFFFVGGIVSLLNGGGVNMDLNISPIDLQGYLFAPIGLADEKKKSCDDEDCDYEGDEDDGIVPNLVSENLAGSGGGTQGSGNSGSSGGGGDSAGDDAGAGTGPEVETPQAGDSGSADENWSDNIPNAEDWQTDPAQVEQKFVDDLTGSGGQANQGEKAGEFTQPDDTANHKVQEGASSEDPDSRTTDGDPITLHNAEVLDVERALKIPGRGMDFEFVRTYRSRIEYDGPVGYNWDHNFNKRLVKVDRAYCEANPLDTCCNEVKWSEKPEGFVACYIRFNGEARYDAYRYDEAGKYFRAPLGYFDRLVARDDGTVTIRDRHGITHSYAADGFCTSIEDSFGNRMRLEYEGSGKERHLVRVIDTLDRTIAFRYSGRHLVEVEDFTGRKLHLGYDIEDNLTSFTKPATAAFPNGTTTTYAYSSGYPKDKMMLNHNLVSVTDALGQKYVEFAYSFSDRVVWHRFGDGIFTIQSTMMGSWPACQTQEEVNRVASRTRIIDRNGNERLHEFNCQGNALAIHVFTRGLRQGDPAEFATRYTYDLNGLTTSVTKPAGNRIEISYEQMQSGDPTVDRLFAANPVLIRRVPDAERGGSAIETSFSFEPLAMQPLTETREGITRTHWYDYQEGATTAQLAAEMEIAETTAVAVFAGVSLAQGDLNGDGATDGMHGSAVRVDEPLVHDMQGNEQVVRRFMHSNEHGQLVSERDPEGIETAYSYYAVGDQRGFLESRTIDPAGLALRTIYEYDSAGDPVKITDASSAVTRNAYDQRGRVVEITDATGAITRNTCDAEGNLVRVDRPGSVQEGDLWITTKYSYNMLNRPILREDETTPDNYVITELRYDPGERLTRVIEPLGNSTVTDYDERDLVMRVRKGAGSGVESIEARRYDANGNLIEITDGAGGVTQYAYDGHDRVVKVVNPAGTTTLTQYDAFDRPVAISKYGEPDPGGDPQTLISHQGFIYDELGRRLVVWDYAVANGVAGAYHETSSAYDAAGRKVLETDALGNSSIYEYDAAGRLVRTIDAAGNEALASYDGMGRPLEIKHREFDESSGQTNEFAERFAYDGMGRLISHEDPMGHVERSAYDGRGNLIWQADAKGAPGLDAGGDTGPGNVQRFSYDGLNRLSKLTQEMRSDGSGSGALTGQIQTAYAWDDNGNVETITDANGNATSYQYDAQDRRIATELPDGAAYLVEYDGASRPVRETDPRGIIVRKSYDTAGRMTLRTASRNGATLRRDELSYDGLGRMRAAVSRDGNGVAFSSLEEGFDAYGRNDQSRQDGIAVTRTFDALGRVLSVAGQNGNTAVYQRDAIGRVSSIAEVSLGIVALPEYAGPTRNAKVTLGNGLVFNESYDEAARPVSMQVEDAAHSLITGFEVGYDRAGQKLYEKRLHEAGRGELYQYDSIDRLIAASQGVPGVEQHVGETVPGAFAKHVTYAIDPVHNWTSRVEYRDPSNTALNVARTYSPNSLNQYTAMSGSIDGSAPLNTSFIYDEAGNLVDDGKYRYTYDDRNLVTEVRNSLTDDFVASYAYDALKRRTSELRADGTVTQFIYDGWQEVQEITDNVLTASYIYDDGVDHPIAMIANGRAYYYHADSRNNIAAITDESGALIERYSYDPYGAATITDDLGQAIPESTIGNAYRFSSRRYDEATGLYYYRHRMYSPELGRFLQRDPVGYGDSMNLFAYVNDSPTNNGDPYGLRLDWESSLPAGWDPHSAEVWNMSSPGPGAPGWYPHTDAPGALTMTFGNYDLNITGSISLGLIEYSTDLSLNYTSLVFGIGLNISLENGSVDPLGGLSVGSGKNLGLSGLIGWDGDKVVPMGASIGIGPSIGPTVSFFINEASLRGSQYARSFGDFYNDMKKKIQTYSDITYKANNTREENQDTIIASHRESPKKAR